MGIAHDKDLVQHQKSVLWQYAAIVRIRIGSNLNYDKL